MLVCAKKDPETIVYDIDTIIVVDKCIQPVVANPLPDFFEICTKSCDSSNTTDFNDPDKSRGFLSLQETNFEFIGPDRDFCDCAEIDQVVNDS